MKHAADKPKSQPSWSDVKRQLTALDRAALLSLVGELYRFSKDNQVFFHARLQLGDDPLSPYKDTIARWIYPDLFKNQEFSVAKAKKAISDYRKAVGDKTGLLELMTLYCEEAAAFATDIALDDEGFYDALVRMFEEALKTIKEVPPEQGARFFARLQHVGRVCSQVGYGVGDDMEQLLDGHIREQGHLQPSKSM